MAPLTRNHTAPAVDPDAPALAVTLKGMVSPLESTLKIALLGAGPAVPVVKLKVRAGGGVVKFDAVEVMLNVGGGFLTDKVTLTAAGLLPAGTVFTVISPA